MYSKEGLEFACDELAEVIDQAQGVLNIEAAIDTLIAKISEQDENVVAETFKPAMLEKFNEVYQCDPATFAENSEWAHELDDVSVLIDDEFDLEDDLMSLRDDEIY